MRDVSVTRQPDKLAPAVAGHTKWEDIKHKGSAKPIVWVANIQHGDDPAAEETELVTLTGFKTGTKAEPGATIELTDGTRVTLVERIS